MANSIQQLAYTYVVAILGVASGDQGTGVLQIESGSTFRWMQSTVGVISNATDLSETPNATVQIVDTSSNAAMFSTPAYLGGVFGTGRLPFVLPKPRVMAGNTALNFTIVNNLANSADFYLHLVGSKIYGYVPPYNG